MVHKKGSTYEYKCGGRQKVKDQMSLIYKDANVYLERKYDKYKELMKS